MLKLCDEAAASELTAVFAAARERLSAAVQVGGMGMPQALRCRRTAQG